MYAAGGTFLWPVVKYADCFLYTYSSMKGITIPAKIATG